MVRLNTRATRGKSYFLISAVFWAAWLGIFSVGPAWGEDKEIKTLTREEALKIALEKNKDIQKAREYKNSVEGRYVEERSAALPQLTLNGGFTRDRDDSLKNLFRGLFPPEKETAEWRSGFPSRSTPSEGWGRRSGPPRSDCPRPKTNCASSSRRP